MGTGGDTHFREDGGDSKAVPGGDSQFFGLGASGIDLDRTEKCEVIGVVSIALTSRNSNADLDWPCIPDLG